MWPSLYTYWSVGQRQVQNYNALFQALECHLTVSCVFSLSSQEEYVSRGFDVWNLLLVYLDIFINNGKNISGFWETKNYSSGLEISGNLQLHLEETLLSFFSASWIVVFLPWLFLLDLALYMKDRPSLFFWYCCTPFLLPTVFMRTQTGNRWVLSPSARWEEVKHESLSSCFMAK